jgi:aminomethyltransferase
MPIPTPFHPRTAPLNQTQEWRNWSGYLSASLYQVSHEPEYYAIRNAAALIDVSPLFKYEVRGPDAAPLLNRIMTRNIAKCAIGQVMYTPWCDDDGKVIDDGTVARLEADRFRVTAADPNLVWFQDCALGMDVEVVDISSQLVALALQGPNSREILKQILSGIDLYALRYYRLANAQVSRFPLSVTRTGYTGDLGYELWIEPEYALGLWSALVEAGSSYGLLPAGIVALDIARVEAGLLLIEVDYISSRKALIPEQVSTPYELGLGWTVDLEKGYFIGREALLEEKRHGSQWAFVGLEIDWGSLEALFAAVDLPPLVAGRASRSALPVYQNGRHIGQATSHVFSPLLKKYIALASLQAPFARLGSVVQIEITVEYVRHTANAVVTALPFYDPLRKRS